MSACTGPFMLFRSNIVLNNISCKIKLHVLSNVKIINLIEPVNKIVSLSNDSDNMCACVLCIRMRFQRRRNVFFCVYFPENSKLYLVTFYLVTKLNNKITKIIVKGFHHIVVIKTVNYGIFEIKICRNFSRQIFIDYLEMKTYEILKTRELRVKFRLSDKTGFKARFLGQHLISPLREY